MIDGRGDICLSAKANVDFGFPSCFSENLSILSQEMILNAICAYWPVSVFDLSPAKIV